MDSSPNQSLAGELEKLKTELKSVHKQHEVLVEAVNDVTSKVVSLETESKELEKENETLLETLKESTCESNKIDKSDDEIVSMLKEKLRSLQSELDTESEEVQAKVAALESNLIQSNTQTSDKQDGHDKCKQEICLLQAQIEDLKEELCYCEKHNENLLAEKVRLTVTICELEKNINELNCLIGAKSESLSSSLETLKSAEEEKKMLCAEIASLKAPGGGGMREKSLFSEVEDKRQSKATELQYLVDKYNNLKQDIIMKNGEIKTLKSTNSKLKMQWDDEVKKAQEENSMLLECYRNRIHELMIKARELSEERPECPQVITITEDDHSQLPLVDDVIKKAKARAQNLHADMVRQSIPYLGGIEMLRGVHQDIKVIKTQLDKDQAEIKQLRSCLSDYDKENGSIQCNRIQDLKLSDPKSNDNKQGYTD